MRHEKLCGTVCLTRVRLKELRWDAFHCMVDKWVNKSWECPSLINLQTFCGSIIFYFSDFWNTVHVVRLTTRLGLIFHRRAFCCGVAFALGLRRRDEGIQMETHHNLSRSFPSWKQRCLRRASVASGTKNKTITFFRRHDVHLMRVCLSFQTRHVLLQDANKEKSPSCNWWQNSLLCVQMTWNKAMGKIY